MEKELNNLVYKYCSYDTFLKIIKSKTIYLNDITKLNDKRELLLYKNLLENALKIFINKYSKDTEIKDFYNGCVKSIEFWFNEDNEMYKYFVSCFSKAKDSNLMWHRYGSNDRGMCIGIDESIFKLFNDGEINYIQMQYRDDEEINILENIKLRNEDIYRFLLEKLVTLYEKYKKNNKLNQNDSFSNNIINNFIKFCFTYSAFYKTKWWEDEKEYRIGVWGEYVKSKEANYRLFEYDGAYTEKGNCKIEDEKDITKNNTFHKIFDFSKNTTIIKEIWIGPLCEVSIQNVYELLHFLNYENVFVNKSKGEVKNFLR